MKSPTMWKTEKKESVQESPKGLEAFLTPVNVPVNISVVDSIRALPSEGTNAKKRRRKPKQVESAAKTDEANVRRPECTADASAGSPSEYAKQRPEILGKSPEYWSEATLYKYFTTVTPLILPELVEVEEVLLRRIGGVKMKVTFKNTSGELCPVWMSGSLIYEYYNDAYLKAQKYFAQRI